MSPVEVFTTRIKFLITKTHLYTGDCIRLVPRHTHLGLQEPMHFHHCTLCVWLSYIVLLGTLEVLLVIIRITFKDEGSCTAGCKVDGFCLSQAVQPSLLRESIPINSLMIWISLLAIKMQTPWLSHNNTNRLEISYSIQSANVINVYASHMLIPATF